MFFLRLTHYPRCLWIGEYFRGSLIAQHLHGAAEGRLRIDHPVVTMETTEQFRELSRIGDSRSRTRTLKFLTAVEAFEAGEKLAAKDATQDSDR